MPESMKITCCICQNSIELGEHFVLENDLSFDSLGQGPYCDDCYEEKLRKLRMLKYDEMPEEGEKA